MRSNLKLPKKRRTANNPDQYITWAQDPSQENWETLYSKLQPTVATAIKSFGGNDPSLKVRAMILAKEAVNSYDPENLHGASLPTYVYNHLKRLNRFREERTSPVYYPESVRDDRRAVYRYKQAFREKHDRDPSRHEVLDDMAISSRRLDKAQGLMQDVPESGMESEKGHMAAKPLDPLARRRQMRTDYVYQDQDNIGKKIMEYGMGYGGEGLIPKAHIATKLGISAPAISKRITKINEKIEAPESYDQSTTDMQPITESYGEDTDLTADVLGGSFGPR